MSDEIRLFDVFRVNNSTGHGERIGTYAAKSAADAERVAEDEFGKPGTHMWAFEAAMPEFYKKRLKSEVSP